MPEVLMLCPLTDAEIAELRTLAEGRKVEARLRDRARICWLSQDGTRVREIAVRVGADDRTVRWWIHRFDAQGIAGLRDAPRSGRPATDTPAIAIKRSRIGELLQAEGLRWRTQETWFGARVDPAFAEKRGRSSPSTRSRPQAAS